MRFNVHSSDTSCMKCIIDMCVFFLFLEKDHFFAPRRVEAWRDLFWVPLGSCYYYCFGWGGDLYYIFLEDCVVGELCTVLALVLCDFK